MKAYDKLYAFMMNLSLKHYIIIWVVFTGLVVVFGGKYLDCWHRPIFVM